MFKYAAGHLLHGPTLATGPEAKAPPSSMPGGILSVSAAPDGTNGIIWGTVPQDCSNNADPCNAYAGGDAEGAIDATVPGAFAAFDANTLAELWSDTSVGYFAKFTPPTVANGKVYVANFGNLWESCAGNYNTPDQSLRATTACGHVQVYGLKTIDVHIPNELIRWPYIWIDPGPLTPTEQEEMLRLRRGD
jgi:outer membrane protein assembly factor BamB